MGIFGFKNKYDICPKESEFKSIVTNYHIRGDKVKMNAKLVVPEGYVFVMGKNGKVTDKFEKGEYFFNISNLPYMCRKFKIDRANGGKPVVMFSADTYFINMSINESKFETYRKVEMGTRAYGFYKAGVVGTYKYRVIDVKEYMQSLLNEYDYIKTGEAENILESWVSECVVDALEKNNYMLNDVLNNSPKITEDLTIRLKKLFAIAGLELIELKITNFKLPKKYSKRKETEIEKTQEVVDEKETPIIDEETEQENKLKDSNIYSEDISEDVKEAQSLIGVLGEAYKKTINEGTNSEIAVGENINVDINNEIEEGQKSLSEEYVPFGNFIIENKPKELINSKNESVQVNKKKSYVDLTLNNLYNEQAKTKKCEICGADNIETAEHCVLCGEKFKNI